MASKQMQAIITLAGKVDPSLEKSIKKVEKELGAISKMKGIEGGMKSLASGAANVAKGVGRAVAGAAAAAGAAGLAIGGAALQSYASYEQLVGGVETLFKDSAGTVQQYAADAYKTAGVSANIYMEQATAFSASLIQSLGGDTAAAASYADLAIKDMSDNANKMGTDISSIQQTYQSLMRGNYAMLDNLKLGYGGTKSELERLVKDASELTGKALDPSKFSDVITAIHAVQEQMGITGTTALEASTTIEGSVNSAKAAWENWLSGLGTDGADMGALTEQLVSSVSDVAKNVGPAVQRIASSLFKALPGALSGIGSAIAPVLVEALAGAWNVAAQALGSAGIQLPTIDAAGIMSTVSEIASAVAPVIQGIGSVFSTVMPSIVSGIQGLVQSIGPAVSIIVSGLGPAVSNFATSVIPPLMSALSGVLPLLASIATAILPPIVNFLTPIISLVMQIASAVIPPLTAAIQFLTPAIQLVISAVMMLTPIFSGLMGVITTLTTPITSIGAVLLPQMGAAFSALQGPLNVAIGIFNAVVSALSPIISGLGSIISLAGQAAGALANIGGGIIGGIGSFFGFARGGFTSGPYVAGEDPRYPNEAVISFNPAYRAQNVQYWARAGHMLGVSPASVSETSPASGGGGVTYDFSGMTFAPNVTVRGNASKDDIIAAIRQCEGEFVDMVKDMLDRDGEAAYA